MSTTVLDLDNFVSGVIAELAATKFQYDETDMLAQARDLAASVANLRSFSHTCRVFRAASQSALWKVTGGLRGLIARIPSTVSAGETTGTQPALSNVESWTNFETASQLVKTLFLNLQAEAGVDTQSDGICITTNDHVEAIRACAQHRNSLEVETLIAQIHGGDCLRGLIQLVSSSVTRLEIEFTGDAPDHDCVRLFFEELPKRAPNITRLVITGPLGSASQVVVNDSMWDMHKLATVHFKVDSFVGFRNRFLLWLDDLSFGYIPRECVYLLCPTFAPSMRKLSLSGASATISKCFTELRMAELEDLRLELTHHDPALVGLLGVCSGIGRGCPNLRRLGINSLDFSGASPFAFSHLKACSALQEVVIRDEFVFQGHPTFFRDSDIETLATGWPHLQMIKLLPTSPQRASVLVFSPVDLIALLRHCPGLNCISAGVDLNGQNAAAVLNLPLPLGPPPLNPSLRQLELGSASQMPDAAVAARLEWRYWRNAQLSYRE